VTIGGKTAADSSYEKHSISVVLRWPSKPPLDL